MPRVRSTGTATASADAAAATPPSGIATQRRHASIVAEIGRGIAADGGKAGDAEIELSGRHRQKSAIGEHDVDREQDQNAFEITAHARAPALRAAEQAGRPHDQDEQQQPVDRNVDEVGAEHIDREHSVSPMMSPPAMAPQMLPMPPTTMAEMPLSPSASPMNGCTCR